MSASYLSSILAPSTIVRVAIIINTNSGFITMFTIFILFINKLILYNVKTGKGNGICVVDP